jgi:Ca2+-transporting ATPase
VNMTTMQLLQSFFARSLTKSIFTTGIIGNLWIIGAFIVSFGSLVAGCYIPGRLEKMLNVLRELD